MAAEFLGRTGTKAALPAIVAALTDDRTDRFLDHSLTYALIEIGAREETALGLNHSSPRVRRAALTALDQMPDGRLEAKAALAELDSPDASLKETAWWIAGRHPEWGGQLAGRFAEQLEAADALTPAARGELGERLVKFAKNDAVQKTLADAVANAPSTGCSIALRAMSRSSLKVLPEPWRKGSSNPPHAARMPTRFAPCWPYSERFPRRSRSSTAS